MASTLDSVIKQVTTDLKIATSKTVHGTVNDVLQGRRVDPSVVGSVSNTVIDRAIGGLINNATFAVNQTISKALGKKFKNSALNVIAGNYVAAVLTQVITGRQTASISARLTNAVAQGISQELFARLPKSITKSVNINVLGTKFNTSLNPIISKAVNDTVGAIVNAALSSPKSAAALPSISGITNALPTIPSPSLPSFSGIPKTFSNLTGSLGGMLDSLGSSIGNVFESITSGSSGKIENLTLPAGVDMTRFSSSSPGLGKLIEMSSAPIGEITKVPGLSREQYQTLQTQLAQSNVNNPMATYGGDFNITDIMMGKNTSSGTRSITKDWSFKFSDINRMFGVLSPNEKKMLDGVRNNTIDMASSVAKNASDNAATFKPTTTDQLEKLTTLKEGFRDPNAKYPLPDYSARTETNKLATSDTENTIVDRKNASRMVGAQLPNGGSWSQPVSPYNAKYPYNHVTETEAGHVVELDDTPNAERIHVFHKSGTFMEVDAVGNRVQVIKGSDYTIIDANGYISIQGKANVSVTGSCNVFIGADANIEVSGNAIINSHNNMELNAAGRLKLSAGEGIDIRSPEIFMDADNQLQINSDVSTKIHSKEFNLIVDTDMKVDVHNDYRITVDGNSDTKVKGITKQYTIGKINVKTDAGMFTSVGADYNLAVKTDYKQSVGGSIYEKASGSFNVQAGGNAAVDAANVYLNSGSSTIVNPTPAVKAENAGALETEYADTHYLSARKSIAEVTIPDKFAQSFNVSKVANIMANLTSDAPVSAANIIANKSPDGLIGTGMLSGIASGIGISSIDSIVKSSLLDNIKSAVANKKVPDETKAVLVEDMGVDPKVIDRAAIVVEEAKPVTNNAPVIIPDELPTGNTPMPYNFKLSPHFTIASFTTEALTPASINPIEGVATISQIVSNLQYMALNVMEPVYAVRPDVVICSGIVAYDNSQTCYKRENFGLRVMLDFTNAASFDDYYDIADSIRRIVPFDTMTVFYLSKDFTGGSTDHAVIAIDVSGVFYPKITDAKNAQVVQQWIQSNNKQKLKTWYNGRSVNDNNLVKVA